jgi:hypothetical protein
VVFAGNGNGDTIEWGSADTSTITGSPNAGLVTSQYGLGYDTFIVGKGQGDTIANGSGDYDSYYAGGGGGDSVAWMSGNYSLASLGDGSLDSVNFQTGSNNCVTLGDGNYDAIDNNNDGSTTGNNNTLTLGDGNYDIASITTGNDNLLQCGDGNGDVLAIGNVTFGLLTVPPYATPPVTPAAYVAAVGTGTGNVLEAGNGTGDFLLGGDGANTMVAGDGLGNASFNTSQGQWYGTWGDTLTGNGGTDVSGGFTGTGSNPYVPATTFTGGDTYVLNCGGGDLVQDSSGALDGAMIADFAGMTQSQSGSGGNGGNCGNNNGCGGNNSNGCDSQGSASNAINAIDVTDMFGSDATGLATAPAAGTNQIDFGSDQLTCVFQSSTDTSQISVADYGNDSSVSFSLFGQYSAGGFSLGTDNGIVNDENSYESFSAYVNGYTPSLTASSTAATPSNGLLITYDANNVSSCGGSNNNNCGGSSSGGGSNCGGSSYGGDCGGSSISNCSSGYENPCISSPGCG